MKISKLFSNILLTLFIVVSLSVSYSIAKIMAKPPIFVSRQESSYNINNAFWTYFHLGQKRLISSLMWVTTIVDADVEHYKKRDLNSWIFLRFSTISILEPLFKETYSFGGPYLSIAKDDITGASYIYDRGLKFYPNDYNILYNASFHYYFESHEYDKAKVSLERLIVNPKTPLFAFTSLARIKADQVGHEDAYIFLSEYLKKLSPDSIMHKKITQYLYRLKADIDLECLNHAKDSNKCALNDYEGIPYRKEAGAYIANKNYPEFKIKRRK